MRRARAPARRRWPSSSSSPASSTASAACTSRLSETSAELLAVAASHGAGRCDQVARLRARRRRQRLRPERRVHDVPPLARSSSRQTTTPSSPTSSGSKPRRSCSTRSPSCGCWRATRCATGGRSSRSSSSSSAGSCTVLLLDDLHRPRADDLQLQSIAHGVIRARAAHARVRRRAAAPARHQVCAARRSAAAITTTSSDAAGSRSSRGWSPPSTARRSSADRLPSGARRRSTRCSAAASSAAPARSIVGPAGHRQVDARPRSSPSPRPRRGERAALFIFDESLEHAAAPRCDGLGIDLAGARRRGPDQRPAGRPGRAVARRVRRTRSAPAWRSDDASDGRHRQPERLPQRDAGRALPRRPAARAAHLPRPARRGDHPGRWRSRA